MFGLLILFQNNIFFPVIKYLYIKKLRNRGMRVNLYKLYFLSLHFSILQPNTNKEN